MELYKKLTTTFILLFIASITVGFSLKGAIPYATLVSIICATLFLLSSAFCAGKARHMKG
ncbi:hypothetical protein CN272_07300 [Bacillus anthracis]|uniref:hypothetical protein n=1 Tax=Bacillus TaxID=1386 RepID=UPI0003FE2196|nr:MULTISPECIES: hypothetical protein [Bacillus cereus group]OTY59081.1 hypothetical protein BK748_13715 [Bacillus thuringiensis serovar graciosensis]PFC89494.1 hypothetical protein CN272_07300 [Bacillus anthracis]PFT23685.1 hypothetical protein COK52_11880 [Bacillus thuringiensis]AXY06375.1 hypothetical protein CUC43_05160 [Bacillus thuringiensis LM1212]KXY72436.1 hypothetical protein AT270_23010 [Bacillus cereus]